MNPLYMMLIICMMLPPEKDFKSLQVKNDRVRKAYTEKEKGIEDALSGNGIEKDSLEMFIRVFKREQVLELWAKNKNDKQFKHIDDMVICASSGNPGPKRREGDCQVPEGFYFINYFNPESNFYLSLGINYPNRSDRILSPYKHKGGSIFIHGNCVTIGCIPITDDKIKELYIYAIEARNNGQDNIPVHIFPARLTKEGFADLKETFKSDVKLVEFWENLKKGYDYFEEKKSLPVISVLKNGKYSFE